MKTLECRATPLCLVPRDHIKLHLQALKRAHIYSSPLHIKDGRITNTHHKYMARAFQYFAVFDSRMSEVCCVRFVADAPMRVQQATLVNNKLAHTWYMPCNKHGGSNPPPAGTHVYSARISSAD